VVHHLAWQACLDLEILVCGSEEVASDGVRVSMIQQVLELSHSLECPQVVQPEPENASGAIDQFAGVFGLRAGCPEACFQDRRHYFYTLRLG